MMGHPMTPERAREVESICQAALERSGADRAEFLRAACGSDEGLRREVDELLGHEAAAARFLETPPLAVAAQDMNVAPGALVAGQRIGAYTVVSPLGSGGMGEVYRARDATLGREVAIKVLPSLFTNDPERLTRFEREARLLASLNHPNIATIHGIEHVDGFDALVLEVIEGETLADRLVRAARTKTPGLPLQEALGIARQIADALGAAHEKGIVHRDLKPANIKIRPDGVVKVLDFGLAKAVAPPEGSPTVGVEPTRDGILLGTAAYMSPEQARGQAVDKRADIWAFGCVLYEMLTGRVAFSGDTVSDTIAAILERDLPWSTLHAPATVRRLLHRCLAKDPKRRLHDIADARIDIEDVLHGDDAADGSGGTLPLHAGRAWWVALAALGSLVLIGGAAWYLTAQPRPAAPRVTRVTLASSGPAAATYGTRLAITPDGTSVVYAGSGSLFVHNLDQLDARAIATGVSPLNAVLVSPGGQWVGFVEGNKIRKVSVTGGPVSTILEFTRGGATWATDDTLILGGDEGGLRHLSTADGTVTALTQLRPERGELSHVLPHMLPGGKAVLFTITAAAGGNDAAQVALLDLATRTTTVLVRGASDARYVRSGHLVYIAKGALLAIRFDLERMQTHGTAVTVLPQVATSGTGAGAFDVADDGTLVYLDAPGLPPFEARTLVWVDRQSHEEPLGLSPGNYSHPSLSPDESQIALAVSDGLNDNIGVWDVARQRLKPLTLGAPTKFFPVWMPNGRLLFSTLGTGVFSQSADGSGVPELVVKDSRTDGVYLPSGVTPDGTRLLAAYRSDVTTVSLDATHDVQQLIHTPAVERNPVVSPDNRWMAYESNRSGRFEVFIVPFPDTKSSGPHLIAGGTRPLWARRSNELFYVAPGGALMSVRPDAQGGTWNNPVQVVDRRYATETPMSGRNYDVSADGQRFLMVKEPPVDPAKPPRIVVVQNWPEELNRLAPTAH